MTQDLLNTICKAICEGKTIEVNHGDDFWEEIDLINAPWCTYGNAFIRVKPEPQQPTTTNTFNDTPEVKSEILNLNIAVNMFARGMKDRFREMARKGKRGWEQPDKLFTKHGLLELIIHNYKHGNMIDVANLALIAEGFDRPPRKPQVPEPKTRLMRVDELPGVCWISRDEGKEESCLIIYIRPKTESVVYVDGQIEVEGIKELHLAGFKWSHDRKTWNSFMITE